AGFSLLVAGVCAAGTDNLFVLPRPPYRRAGSPARSSAPVLADDSLTLINTGRGPSRPALKARIEQEPSLACLRCPRIRARCAARRCGGTGRTKTRRRTRSDTAGRPRGQKGEQCRAHHRDANRSTRRGDRARGKPRAAGQPRASVYRDAGGLVLFLRLASV